MSGYGFGSTSPRFEQKERHSKEDALTDHEFELLYEGAQRLPSRGFARQCMFAIMMAGRLGLRRGEITHMKQQWVDWDEKMIRIPRHRDCNCGTCRQKAQQKEEHNDDLVFEEAMGHRWHPKTETSIREIPFGFSARIEVILDRFFDKHNEWAYSAQVVNRRINRAAENARQIKADDVYPHALRATAATYHAGRGLDVVPLQSMFGWCDLETPMKYVKQSGKNTARELKGIHNR
jgi:integrase